MQASSVKSSGRERWQALLKGEDVGPFVSPLCDSWRLSIPYRWPFQEPDPFPQGYRWHYVSEQMAMAGTCGWTPSFLAGIDLAARDKDIAPKSASTIENGVTRTETRISTPFGDLTSVNEQQLTNHVIKPMLETEEDYRRMAWVVRRRADYDEDAAVAQGQELRRAIGGRGVLGTWIGAPICSVDRDNMFYHMADWPDACEELRKATMEFTLKQIVTLRKAGFDYLFYCVDGTEWVSPDFIKNYVVEDTREIFKIWRGMDGFILWHSCGKVKILLEAGIYNDLKPDVFETLSEPPVGNLPSLKWARERLDPKIITKGNMPLNILLQGTPDDVRADVCRIREETRGWRHIFGLSDDVLADTPLQNCLAFTDEAMRE